jgi:hypothetical protein
MPGFATTPPGNVLEIIVCSLYKSCWGIIITIEFVEGTSKERKE